jgi:hypothetical protein
MMLIGISSSDSIVETIKGQQAAAGELDQAVQEATAPALETPIQACRDDRPSRGGGLHLHPPLATGVDHVGVSRLRAE